METLVNLSKKIGDVPARKFLELAQHELERDHREIINNLREKNWDAASRKAHSLKGTANLYAPQSLLDHYNLIVKQDVVLKKDNNFIILLAQEFAELEKNIRTFLEEKN